MSENALTNASPSASISMDSPRLLQVSHEKEFLIEKLKYVTSLPRRRKKAKCRLGLRSWRTKKPMLCLHEVTDEDGTLWKNEDESGRRLCEYWCTIFDARIDGERHDCHETILRYVHKAPDDTRWEIDRNEFDELMATIRESAPCPDGIPYSFYRCAGGSGSQFLYKAYKHVIEGGSVPALFASSRTVSRVLRCQQK